MFSRCITTLAASLGLSAMALATDQSGVATLTPNSSLNLETGAVSNSGGDILWNGKELIPQGHAALHNLGAYGQRAFKAIRASHAQAAAYRAEPIPAARLVAGDIFGVRTTGGHYAKVVVAAAEGDALSLQYTTFEAATANPKPAASPGPVITGVLNNYSYILPGLPNYGIAPGSIFIIFGTGLSAAGSAVLQSSAAPGLPASLNQTSVSVTVNGVTTTPSLYYATATGIAAVLPSKTPVGDGTITVTYNGQPSAAAPIHVVASAAGLDTLYGTGYGLAVATDPGFSVLTVTKPATPGQTIILWGSGIGADTANDDRIYPQSQNNLTAIPTQIYIGGIAANILYRGRSQFPGLDQYNVVVPQNVSPGCFVSVVLMTGSVVSNAVTLPVSSSGGPCTDPATGLTAAQLQSLATKGSGFSNSIVVAIAQTTKLDGTSQAAALALPAGLHSSYFGIGYEYVSEGSCTVVPPQQGSFTNIGNILDTGSILVSGPSGQVNLAGIQAPLPGSASPFPGTYTFTSSGGADIGSFKATLNLSTAPITITNASSFATITRSQGATITWTGGFPGGDVQIEGEDGGSFGDVRFYCHAPSSAGQFAIPPSILMALPPGVGKMVVTNYSAGQPITASGVDVGFAVGTALYVMDANFK